MKADLIFILIFFRMDFQVAGVPNQDAGNTIAIGVAGPLAPGRVQAAIAAILEMSRRTVKT